MTLGLGKDFIERSQRTLTTKEEKKDKLDSI